jgi:hypothetical protein
MWLLCVRGTFVEGRVAWNTDAHLYGKRGVENHGLAQGLPAINRDITYRLASTSEMEHHRRRRSIRPKARRGKRPSEEPEALAAPGFASLSPSRLIGHFGFRQLFGWAVLTISSMMLLARQRPRREPVGHGQGGL